MCLNHVYTHKHGKGRERKMAPCMAGPDTALGPKDVPCWIQLAPTSVSCNPSRGAVENKGEPFMGEVGPENAVRDLKWQQTFIECLVYARPWLKASYILILWSRFYLLSPRAEQSKSSTERPHSVYHADSNPESGSFCFFNES